MVIEYAMKREYTPKWMGNDKSESPFVVRHKAPSITLYNQLVAKTVLSFSTGKDGEAEGGEVEVIIDNAKYVRGMLTDIIGLELRDTDSGKVTNIKTVSDLFREDVPAGISGLGDELGQYFYGLLQQKTLDEKN
jgi:hypothetical protein